MDVCAPHVCVQGLEENVRSSGSEDTDIYEQQGHAED